MQQHVVHTMNRIKVAAFILAHIFTLSLSVTHAATAIMISTAVLMLLISQIGSAGNYYN